MASARPPRGVGRSLVHDRERFAHKRKAREDCHGERPIASGQKLPLCKTSGNR